MPTFQYQAKDAHGAVIEGTLNAESERVAADILGERSLFPLDIRPHTGAEGGAGGLLGGTGVGRGDLARTYRGLGDLLGAGVALERALVTQAKGAGPGVRTVLEEVRSEVMGGAGLAEAMSRRPDVFPQVHVNMVRAGETGGFLEGVLTRLADFVEAEHELRGRVMGALIYPAVLLTIGTAVTVFVLIWVVPKFTVLFDEFQGTLPLPTRMLLGVYEFVTGWWWAILGVATAAIAAVIRWRSTPEGERRLDLLRLQVPVLRTVTMQLAVARFSRTLGTLLNGGVPILQALDLSNRAVANKVLEERLDEARDAVREGQSLAGPLSRDEHFPPDLAEVIAVGEEAGNLDKVLLRVAETHEREADRNLDTLVKLLGPLLIVLMAGVVMFLVLGLLLPLFSLSGQM